MAVPGEDERCFRNPYLDDPTCALSFDGDAGKAKLGDDLRVKLLEAIRCSLPVLESANQGNRDQTIYTGATGISLLLHHIATKLYSDSPHERQTYLHRAVKLVEPILSHPDTHKTTFLHGAGGPFAVAAVLYSELGEGVKANDCVRKLKQLYTEQKAAFTKLPSELIFGQSGYVYALLFVRVHVPTLVEDGLLTEIVTTILDIGESQREEQYNSPLMYTWHKKHYLGAAHGVSGILTLLLQVKVRSLQPRIHKLVQHAIDFLIGACLQSGNLPSSLESGHSDRLVHWCHGAPGFVHLMAHAYRVYSDQRYLDTAVKCGEVVWNKGLLRKGYGLCHGVSGNAYTFLQLYRLTGKALYLNRAHHFVEWCLSSDQRACRTPDRPNSLFEGLGGVIYFYVDILSGASGATFPALELPHRLDK